MTWKPPSSAEKSTEMVETSLDIPPTVPEVIVEEGALDLNEKENTDYDDEIASKFAAGTLDSIKESNKRTKAFKTALREMIISFLFLYTVGIIVLPTNTRASYYFTKIMHNRFTQTRGPSGNKFADIIEVDDVWEYMNNQLMAGLYSAALTSKDKQMILLGQPRIRMLKVNSISSRLVNEFEPYFDACNADCQKENKDKNTFAPDGFTDLSAFTYSNATELENSDIWGVYATYGGGGFVQYLSKMSRNESLTSLAFLKYSEIRYPTQENRWIDAGTRLVVVDFAVYNGNVNLFTAIKLIFEFPDTGGVIPSAQFNTMRLIRYVTTFDHLVLMCEAIFMLFTIFFFFEGIVKICITRLSCLKDFWGIIDLFIVGLSVVCIKLSLHRTLVARDRINKLLESGLTLANMDDVVNAEENYHTIAAILLVFACFKVFKYILLPVTISVKKIGGIAVIFIVCFMAYDQFGRLFFLHHFKV